MILPLFTGYLIDNFGLHKLLLIFSGLVTVGQGFFVYGVQEKSFSWMIFGRIIFGIGGESLIISQTRLVTDIFKGKELSLALGLTLSIARFGTVFNNFFSPLFAQYWSVPIATWIGFLSCIWSFICSFLTVFIDLYNRKHTNEIHSASSFGMKLYFFLLIEGFFFI